jgi:hypothetical protein
MVSLKRNKGQLVLSIRGMNKLFSVMNSIRIDFEDITEVSVNLDDKIAIWPGLRMPGTHFPGVIVAGTYLTKGGKHFYLRKRGKESIILELKNHKYSRVVVDVDDPIDAVSQILSWTEDEGIRITDDNLRISVTK